MAFALGNRSAAFFHLGNYIEAISDIHFALSLNYPKASKFKLYERLGKCHLALEDGIKAKTAFQICKACGNEKNLENIEALIEKANSLQQQNDTK